MRRPRSVRPALVALSATAAIALPACGDGGSDDVAPDDTTEMTSETSPEAPPPGENGDGSIREDLGEDPMGGSDDDPMGGSGEDPMGGSDDPMGG